MPGAFRARKTFSDPRRQCVTADFATAKRKVRNGNGLQGGAVH